MANTLHVVNFNLQGSVDTPQTHDSHEHRLEGRSVRMRLDRDSL